MLKKTGEAKITLAKKPIVLFSSDAILKMKLYTKEVNDEVGWLGTVNKIGNNYYVSDVFLFEQDVHGTTTEITPEGLTTFAEEILQEEDGVEKWNNMKLWGHSHVNMGVFASSQDDKQIKELKANTDFFIRVIMNKKDEIKIDIVDDDVIVENADFAEINNQDVTNLLKLIEEAKAQIEEIKLKREEELDVEVKKEVKEKVREKRSVTTAIGMGHYGSFYGRNSYVHYLDEDNYDVYDNVKKNKVRTEEEEQDILEGRIIYYDVEDYIDVDTLIEIATAKNKKEIEAILRISGYGYDYFDSKEIETIIRYSQDLLVKICDEETEEDEKKGVN